MSVAHVCIDKAWLVSVAGDLNLIEVRAGKWREGKNVFGLTVGAAHNPVAAIVLDGATDLGVAFYAMERHRSLGLMLMSSA